MKVTITSIELKGPFKFFALSLDAMRIMKQLSKTPCREFKKSGIWTKHYTMSLWNDEKELRDFAYKSDHLEAMKKAKKHRKGNTHTNP